MPPELRDALTPLLSTLMELAAVVILGVLTLLGKKAMDALSKAKEKYGVEIAQADRERIRQVVTDAIYYAEEVAASAIKRGTPFDGERKMSVALGFVKFFMPGNEQMVKALIRSRLGETKGLGASVNVGT